MVKIGDIITTGDNIKSTFHYFEITPRATQTDLASISRIQPYLLKRKGRQPPTGLIVEALTKFAVLQDDGKLKQVSKPLQTQKPKTGKSQTQKPKTVQGKILNPATGRYVLKTGKIGKALLKKL